MDFSPQQNPQPLPRRAMLGRCGMGFGSVALSGLLADRSVAAGSEQVLASGTMQPKPPHFPPRAVRVIHLFMNGGPSQIDTFDPKPALARFEGKQLRADLKKDRRLGGVGMPSTFRFARHGESGMEISELFPQVARHADDLCVIRSMQTPIPNHEPGFMMMNCGDISRTLPCAGAWTLYGLGTENQSLPGFIVMCPAGLPTAQGSNWRNAFLPGVYQGTYIDSQHRSADELVANIRNDALLPGQQRRQLDFIQRINAMHARRRPDDAQLEARIESLELAFRMQQEAGEAFDISREPQAVRERYGDHVQGRQLLIARRLAERGVRYIQVYHGAGQPWDSHANIKDALPRLARESDAPVAALLDDLKDRDMLKDTLVIWGGEMGRTSTVQLPVGPKPGRDHHHDGFTVWMAGGGVKGGYVHGVTDEVGLKVVENPVAVHDLHATMLHLLGFDHERLTYRHAGRDFRLTDVYGNVVKDILA